MSDTENATNITKVEDSKQVPAIEASRIKLPDFWTDNPNVWFAQAEAQFCLANVSADTTKFFQVIGALPREVCASVLEIVKNPPSKGKYETLKRALTNRHTPSAGRRLEILVDGVELGDRKPSEAYWSMRNLAGESYDEELVRTFWLRRLPKSLYIALTAIGDKPIDDILEIADRIYEATGPSVSSVQTCASTSSQRPVETPLSRLEARLASMESKLEQMSIGRSRSPNPRGASPHFSRRSRSGSRRRFIDKEGFCYYHHKFGNDARRCYLPCKRNHRYGSTNQPKEKNS